MTRAIRDKMEEEPCDVVVVGSCMIDMVCYAHRLPKSGETLKGSKFNTGFGGKGCNQCVAAKNLGGNCLLVARIGDDFFGLKYYDKLNDYRISRKFVKITEGVPTGIAQIIVADNGENQIVITPGANDLLTVTDIEEVSDIIRKCKVLICQLEIPEEVTIAALQIKAGSHIGKSILNAAPVPENLNPLLFTLPDIFCVNETEAATILKIDVRNVEKAKKAMKMLLAKGCKEVVITLGELGSLYGKQGNSEYIYEAAMPAKAVDTTGAGDAFVGALAFSLAKGPHLSIRELLKKANTVASKSVERVGTQESFPLMEELPEEFR